MMPSFSIAAIEARAAAMLMRNRVAPEAAASVARALVAAEAAGQSGHGLRRLPSYAAQARAGKVDGFAAPTVTQTAAAVIRIDVAHGFAYPALDRAVAELPALARDNGVAVAALHRSHHAGMLALTVERLAEAGLAAVMVANTPAAMAAWGGKRALLGTNPIAFAVPLPGAEPLVIDLALSKVARGKIMAAKQTGGVLPADWALDADGRPTTDPEAALAGSMAPLGGAKGAALALMVEVLAAGLTGAQFAFEASSLFDDKGGPPNLGQMIVALDPTACGGADALGRVGILAAAILADDGTRLPGKRGGDLRRRALTDGLTLDGDVLALLDG